VKSAEEFGAVGDLVARWFEGVVVGQCDVIEEEGREEREEKLRMSLEVVCIPCSVRSGSRLSCTFFFFFTT
jgi:hypothetical protein